MNLEQIEAEAMKLPTEDRVQLAQSLLGSLPVDPGIEQIWLEESERRLEELRSGQVAAIPSTDAVRQVRSSLRRHE